MTKEAAVSFPPATSVRSTRRSPGCSRTSRDVRRSVKARGASRSTRYSWDDIARRLHEIYDRVLAA
jgi:hypothetical protein